MSRLAGWRASSGPSTIWFKEVHHTCSHLADSVSYIQHILGFSSKPISARHTAPSASFRLFPTTPLSNSQSYTHPIPLPVCLHSSRKACRASGEYRACSSLPSCNFLKRAMLSSVLRQQCSFAGERKSEWVFVSSYRASLMSRTASRRADETHILDVSALRTMLLCVLRQ